MKVGDKVTWCSQAGGSWTEKRGIVVREIPARESAKQYVPDSARKGHIKFDDMSNNDRILVAVPAGKEGRITHYYCPRKSVVELEAESES